MQKPSPKHYNSCISSPKLVWCWNILHNCSSCKNCINLKDQCFKFAFAYHRRSWFISSLTWRSEKVLSLSPLSCPLIWFHLVVCSVLVSAFVGTAVAFGCFSAAAMLARRREYLYLGGLLSSGISMLLWLHFASSIFGGSTALFKFEVCT